MSDFLIVTAVLLFLIWMGGVGDEPNPCTTYNEMRQIHIETNGEYGWPKGAVKECEDETQ